MIFDGTISYIILIIGRYIIGYYVIQSYLLNVQLKLFNVERLQYKVIRYCKVHVSFKGAIITSLSYLSLYVVYRWFQSRLCHSASNIKVYIS